MKRGRKFIFLFFLIVVIAACLRNKGPKTSWEKTYGGSNHDWANSIQQTSDKGYIMVGSTSSYGVGTPENYNIYLVRIDENGDTIWTRTYGGSDVDHGYSVKQTADGGFIIAGETWSFGMGFSNVYVIKTDLNGDTIWTKTYGGVNSDEGYDISQTFDGGYIIAGTTESFGSGGSDVYLIKIKENGDTLWTKTFGGTGGDYGYSIQETIDRGFIISGSISGHFYLVKTDSNGNSLWNSQIGGEGEQRCYSVCQTSDGGYLGTGFTWYWGSILNSYYDIYLIKFDSIGDTIWSIRIGGNNSECGRSVKETSDGNYVVAGWTDSYGAGNEDVYLIKTNKYGNTLWTKTFGGEGNDLAYSIQVNIDGSYIVGGYTDSFGAGKSNFYIVKTEPD
jgi:Domain of unknown function (DUF5122) beta-propeller